MFIFQEEDESEESGDDESKPVKKQKSNNESEIELMTDKDMDTVTDNINDDDEMLEIEDIEEDKVNVSNDMKKIQSNSLKHLFIKCPNLLYNLSEK